MLADATRGGNSNFLEGEAAGARGEWHRFWGLGGGAGVVLWGV